MEAKSLFIILLAFAPSTLGQCTKEIAKQCFKRSVYEFSMDLTQRIAVETDNHFIASPFSPWTLLAALSLGASQKTYADLKQALRLHTQNCYNNKMFGIIKDIDTVEDGATLKRSASVYVDSQFSIKESFFAIIQRTGLVDVEALDFQNLDEVADTINKNVRRSTNGAINDIVASDELNAVHLLLIDAVFFKGSWVTKFIPEKTEVKDFYGADGVTKIGEVNMMYTETATKLVEIEALNSLVVVLPYVNEKFSMLVFLPNEGVTVSELIDSMETVSLSAVLNVLDDRAAEITHIQLPRFNMSSDLDNLKELLGDMNLRSAFASDATFPGISDVPLFVSNLKQKASIQVNEYGSEASAATQIMMAFKSKPDEFVANRPFFFMIVDHKRQVPIFTGAYSQPTLQ